MTQLYNYEALEALVLKLGFLPFFKNEIPDFSIEEYTPSELWFSDENDGPWEWKGPVAGSGTCAYGKLFNGKAWGIARYTTPGALLDEKAIHVCQHHSLEESKQRLIEYLSNLLPQATESQILRLIG